MAPTNSKEQASHLYFKSLVNYEEEEDELQDDVSIAEDAIVGGVDQGSQYGGGQGTPRRPRRRSVSPSNVTPTRLRHTITQTKRAQDAGVLGDSVKLRALQLPRFEHPTQQLSPNPPPADTPNSSPVQAFSALPDTPVNPAAIAHPIWPAHAETIGDLSADSPANTNPTTTADDDDDLIGGDDIDHLIAIVDESTYSPSRKTGVNDPNDGDIGDHMPGPNHAEADLSDDAESVADGTNLRSSKGRRSKHDRQTLDAACHQALAILEDAAKNLGMQPAKVISHFNKMEQRVRKGLNPWNTYQKYFLQFRDEELTRLPFDERRRYGDAATLVPST